MTVTELIKNRRKSLGALCLQIDEELAELAGFVEQVKPKTVVEIGSFECGWFYLMAPFFGSKATLVGVESFTKVGLSRERMQNVIDRLKVAFDVQIFKGKSVDAFRAVSTFLNGDQIDVLHIDGSHTFVDCMTDFVLYGSLVRVGGLVIFHDVCSRNAAEKVCDVWDIVCKSGGLTRVISHANHAGIGVFIK